jgi:iron complex outermembrane receptor protein
MNRPAQKRVLILLAASTLATAAFAQIAAPKPTPAPDKPKEYDLYTMAYVTVTADAPTTSESNLTSEITAEEIAARNVRTVAEALEFAPGLRVTSGRKSEPNVSVHGFDQSRIAVLIDGVPYYETNYGKLDLNQIPVDNVARIEITKGAASVLYGANAMGGVINIVTKKPAAKPFTGAQLEVGENQSHALSITHGQKRGDWSYWFNVAHRKSEGWDLSSDFEPRDGKITQQNPKKVTTTKLEDGGMRDNSDVESTDVWAKVGRETESGAAYWVNLHYLDLDKGAPASLDSTSVFLKRPRFSQFARIPTYQDTGLDVDIRQPIGERFAVKGKLFYHTHVDDYVSYADQWYKTKIATSRYKDYLVGGSLIGELEVASNNHLRMSVNYKGDNHRERDDSYLPFAESSSLTGSVGIEDDWKISERLSVLAGVSRDWFDVDSAKRNITSSANGDYVRQDELATPSTSSWNPMLGVTYRLADATRLFATAGRKTRFPTLGQLYSTKSGNTELEAERSDNLTVGVARPFGGFANVELSAFYYDIADMISRDGSTVLDQYRNFAQVRMLGGELSVVLYPASNVVVHVDYTYNKAENRSDPRASDFVTNVPEQRAGFGLRVAVPAWQMRFDITGLYMGEVYSSLPTPKYPTDPEKKVDSYFLTDLKVAKDLSDAIEAYLAVRNALDVDYEPEYGFPGQGRSFGLGVSVKL